MEALVFDVSGTVADRPRGVIREGRRPDDSTDGTVDWAAFADARRGAYRPALDRVGGETPRRRLDALHCESLEGLLDRFGAEGLTEAEVTRLTCVRHRLDPWPDRYPSHGGSSPLRARPALERARPAPRGRGRAGRARWDPILPAELAGRYEPGEAVYLTVVDLLDTDAGDVVMVATHEGDLDASRETGLHTAYVHRPLEWGPTRIAVREARRTGPPATS